jgi:SAM-dependent methyltransferase
MRQLIAKDQGEIAFLREVYSKREPGDTDAWSPLHSDLELWHPVRLLIEACWSLRQIPKPLERIRVLDVGCGVGRSSRLLVDLGIKPNHVLGIDFRESAIAYAQQVNPAIRFRCISDLEDWPNEEFDLAVQCTVFSSIPSVSLRRQTATLMERSIGKMGYIFWWDGLRANDFAGGDNLDPTELFLHRKLISFRKVALQPDVQYCFRPLRGLAPWLSFILSPFGHRPTHAIALFGPVEKP